MKFTMYEKESKDRKYRNNPYRAASFDTDHEGYMICPNGKRFCFLRTAPVKGNQYGQRNTINARTVRVAPTERHATRAARISLYGSTRN